MEITIAYMHDNPRTNELPYKEAIASYLDLADRVFAIKVNDSEKSLSTLPKKVKVIDPNKMFDGDWRAAGYFQRSDWTILVEPYQIFSGRNVEQTRRRLERLRGFKIVAFNSFRFVLVNRAVREVLPVAFNRASGLGWDQVLKVKSSEMANCGLFVYSYENVFKIQKDDIVDLSKMLDNARRDLGGRVFSLQPNVHPRYIRSRLSRLSEQNFGFGGWGMLRG